MEWLKSRVSQSIVWLLIPPAACFGFVLARPELGSLIEHFGPLLAGYAALVAAVKGTQEWRNWLRQKQHEKQSEVAGRAIITATKFADALGWLTTFVHLVGDPEQTAGESYNDHLQKKFDSRHERARADLRAYEEACLQAEAFLPDAALQRVRAMWDLYIEVRRGWRRFAQFATKDPTHLAFDGQKQVMEAEEKIAARLEALRTELRRHTIGGNL